jgi:hypothetical protein
MTRLRHYDDLHTARFVTFSCYRRSPALPCGSALGLTDMMMTNPVGPRADRHYIIR